MRWAWANSVLMILLGGKKVQKQFPTLVIELPKLGKG